MLTLITTVHILTCLVMISFVLLQGGGEGGGGLFGGTGSHGIIGATSTENVLSKITKFAAIVLAATSIGLTAIYNHQRSSVLHKQAPNALQIPSASDVAPAPVNAPATPTTPTTSKSNSTNAPTSAPTSGSAKGPSDTEGGASGDGQ